MEHQKSNPTKLVNVTKWRENNIVTHYLCRGIRDNISGSSFHIAISDLFGTKALYPLRFGNVSLVQGQPNEETSTPAEFAKWFVHSLSELLPSEVTDAIRNELGGGNVAAASPTAICANPRCKSPDFVQVTTKQAFCSTRCRVAAFRAKPKTEVIPVGDQVLTNSHTICEWPEFTIQLIENLSDGTWQGKMAIAVGLPGHPAFNATFASTQRGIPALESLHYNLYTHVQKWTVACITDEKEAKGILTAYQMLAKSSLDKMRSKFQLPIHTL